MKTRKKNISEAISFQQAYGESVKKGDGVNNDIEVEGEDDEADRHECKEKSVKHK